MIHLNGGLTPTQAQTANASALTAYDPSTGAEIAAQDAVMAAQGVVLNATHAEIIEHDNHFHNYALFQHLSLYPY